MTLFFALKEERFIHRTFEFKKLSNEEAFDSPYKFDNYFDNLSYNNFVKNVTELMQFYISHEEKTYLSNFFGKKKINNSYTISKLIKNNKYPEFIDTVIICKRIEFLYDFIKYKKMSDNHINYIDNLLQKIYKTRAFLSYKIHKKKT
tara:strand:+ start:2946 stop:3386 length:441 start_codon:yes stop_codon:yes gene_type:complete